MEPTRLEVIHARPPVYLLFLFNLFFLAALAGEPPYAWASLFAIFSFFAGFAFKTAEQR
jgi:hypothetical protein